MSKKNQKAYKDKYSSPIFSRFNNFEPRSNTVEQKPSTSLAIDKHDKLPPFRDTKSRRIIMRETLYEDPDLFNCSQEPSYPFQRLPGWLKSGENSYTFDNEESGISHKQNKIQKELNKMLAKPVQGTKAERMMEKMGWQGGALGKHGDGIIEPIAPNASYATKTIGLGQTAKRIKIMNKKVEKDEEKEYFYTNVLFNVLDFVKNDSEKEIAFDNCLCKRERKWVHDIAAALANNDKTVSTDFDTIVQMEIVQEIFKFNDYLLTTESEGIFPNRSLCLYKEAPDNMYLVTPDDLKEDAVDNSEQVDDKQSGNQTKSSDSHNTVDANISEIKKDINSLVNDPLLTIIDYFTEFVEDDDYKEFRFLGPFNNEEIDAINTFVDKCTKNEFKENDVLKEVFTDGNIEIEENCNSNTIFCKRSKNQ